MIIMDESTGNLAPASAATARDSVTGLVSMGVTMPVVARNRETMKAMDHVSVLEARGIVEQGRWDELKSQRDGRRKQMVGVED